MFLNIMGLKGRFLTMMVGCVDMVTCSCMEWSCSCVFVISTTTRTNTHCFIDNELSCAIWIVGVDWAFEEITLRRRS